MEKFTMMALCKQLKTPDAEQQRCAAPKRGPTAPVSSLHGANGCCYRGLDVTDNVPFINPPDLPFHVFQLKIADGYPLPALCREHGCAIGSRHNGDGPTG